MLRLHRRVEPQPGELQQVDRADVGAARRPVAEHALHVVVGARDRVVRRRLVLLRELLVVAEVEQLALQDRTAGAAAPLVAIEVRLGQLVAVVEPAVGAQLRVPVELVDAAVQLVGARRRDHPHLRGAAGGVDALRVGDDRELADDVRGRAVGHEVERVRADEVVLDVDAVLRRLRPRRTAAVDGGAVARGHAGHARLQADQLDRVARVERQLEDLLLAHGVGHFRRRRVDEIDAGRHLHRFAQSADLERRRQRVLLAGVDLDVVVGHRLEPGELDLHRVVARPDLREDERAVGLRRGFDDGAGGAALEDDAGAGHHRAAAVADDADDAAEGGLGQDRRGGRGGQERRQEHEQQQAWRPSGHEAILQNEEPETQSTGAAVVDGPVTNTNAGRWRRGTRRLPAAVKRSSRDGSPAT